MLILKSQSESLSEQEIAQLNALVRHEGGAEEATALIDQLCAFTDSGGMDSLPIAEVLSDVVSEEAARKMILSGSLFEGDRGHSLPTGNSHMHNPQARSSAWGQWSMGGWLAALAASHLILASLVWVLASQSQSGRPGAELAFETAMAQAEKDAIQSVAASPHMVSMTACVWRASSGEVPAVGESIEHGEALNLLEGIAELRVGEGTSGEALVRIEGPASVFVLSNGGLGLHQGSLTAKSLGTGSGSVTIDTPIGEVTMDGQSSVGLVADKSVSEVHLFSGQAVVQPTLAVSTARELRLEAGEAIRFSSQSGGDYGAVWIEASMSNFVSARSSGFDPLNLGEDYVNAVMESRPSIYWRFEELSGGFPYHVKNQGSLPGMDAEVLGESGWRRYGENRVAELGKLGTLSGFRCSGLWPPKPLDEYTIEMWVKPELYHHGEMFCMHEKEPLEDGRYAHTLMLESLAQHWHSLLENLQPNRFRFVHRTPASGFVTDGSNLVAEPVYQVRIWQHLVAQKKGDQVLLWLDGQLTAELTDLAPLSKDMQVIIGQLYADRAERRFVGQIDEVAIYDRCLTPAELHRHIEAAGRKVADE